MVLDVEQPDIAETQGLDWLPHTSLLRSYFTPDILLHKTYEKERLEGAVDKLSL